MTLRVPRFSVFGSCCSCFLPPFRFSFFFPFLLLFCWLHSTAKFAPFLYFKWCVKGHAGVDGPYPLPGSSYPALLGETHKSYQNATYSCSPCVCVLGGFNYLHSLLFTWQGRDRKLHSYLICHLISNMRHEFHSPFPRHLKPILINSQLISYEFLSEFPVGWQIEEDSFVFKCKCLHFQ